MSAPATTLPADWSEFLHDTERHVEAALAEADARLQQVPAHDPEQHRQDRQETAHLQECLLGLQRQLEAADQLVQDLDRALLGSEQHLRHHAESAASLRQKLAAWAGGAIG